MQHEQVVELTGLRHKEGKGLRGEAKGSFHDEVSGHSTRDVSARGFGEELFHSPPTAASDPCSVDFPSCMSGDSGEARGIRSFLNVNYGCRRLMTALPSGPSSLTGTRMGE